MFKTIMKSFSALFIFAALFYSCGEQVVQPPSFVNSNQIKIYEKTGLVQIVSTNNGFPKSGGFNTGEINAAGFKKLKINFKSETNSDGSSISLYLGSPWVKSRNIFTFINPSENSQGTDHSIDIEDPSEKIWLSFNIKLGTYNGDENFNYIKVSDFVIYGIR